MFFMVYFTLLACEIAMGVMGIIALITGGFNYRAGRPVTGVAAYIAGIVFLIPLAAVFPLTLALGKDMSEADAIGMEIVVRALAIVVCFFGAYILAALLYNPMSTLDRKQWLKEAEKRRKRRRRNRDDEDEDEDEAAERRRRRRRRREREEDEYDDEPPRRDDDDEEDVAPRRRPAADDDDDTRHSHRPGPPPLPRR